MDSIINSETFTRFNRISERLRDALIELSDAAQDYEKRRQAAQQRLTTARGDLAVMISLMKHELNGKA